MFTYVCELSHNNVDRRQYQYCKVYLKRRRIVVRLGLELDTTRIVVERAATVTS